MNAMEQRSRSNNKVAAAVVVTMILGVFVAISHHPVGSSGSLASAVASISRLSAMDQLVHGAIMVMLVLLCAAMTLFSDRLGRDGFAVIAANSAYTFGVGLALIAMGFDGFVLPALADRA